MDDGKKPGEDADASSAGCLPMTQPTWHSKRVEGMLRRRKRRGDGQRFPVIKDVRNYKAIE